MNIYLVGMSGSGKSALGKALAKKRAMRFIDTDFEITKYYGKTPEEIILSEGELALRQAETKILQMITKEDDLLVATGGGFPIFNKNMETLNNHGFTIYLSFPPYVLWSRLQRSHHRPLVKSKAQLYQLLKQRKFIYEQAHIVYEGKRGFETNLLALDVLITTYLNDQGI